MARTFAEGFFSDVTVNNAVVDISAATELTLFVGAGVSVDRGIPTWAALVRQALADSWAMAVRNGALQSEANLDFKKIIDQTFQLPAASMADQLYAEAKKLGPSEARNYRNGRLREFIYKNYTVPTQASDRSLARQVLSFAATVKAADPSASLHIITTNYDDLLSDIGSNDADILSLDISFKRYTDEAPPRHSESEVPIVHLHGHIPHRGKSSRPVFSEADYVWWTHESPLRQYVTQRLDRGTTLMLGASLRDYNIVTYLKQTHIDDPHIKRFAILPTADDPLFLNEQAVSMDALDQLRTARGRQLGVTILSPNYFGQVNQFLIEMEHAIKASALEETYIPYMSRLEIWWSHFRAKFEADDFRQATTARLRDYVAQLSGGLLSSANHLKIEIWARTDITDGRDPRQLELWCSSQFQYVFGRPGWPKHLKFGTDDSKAVIEAFAARDFVVGEYIPDARWTHVIASPIILSEAPYSDIPVGVVSVSLHVDNPASKNVLSQVEANRDAINETLQQVGRACLLPDSPAPRA